MDHVLLEPEKLYVAAVFAAAKPAKIELSHYLELNFAFTRSMSLRAICTHLSCSHEGYENTAALTPPLLKANAHLNSLRASILRKLSTHSIR
jgi:hypothetical protein